MGLGWETIYARRTGMGGGMSGIGREQGFTPGPWWACFAEDQPVAYYRGLVMYVSSDPYITVCTGHEGDKSGRICAPDEWEANARLIAAAPELYEALKAVHALIVEGSMTGFNCHSGDWADRLYRSQWETSEALKKATGVLRVPIASASSSDSRDAQSVEGVNSKGEK